MNTDLVTTGEAADILGVSAQTIRSYYDRGLLTGVTLPSGQRRIHRAAVDALHQEANDE